MASKRKVVIAVGKRKTAIARATLEEGDGTVRINKKPLQIIEPEVVREKIAEPLFIASELGIDLSNISISVNVRGGGFMGQAEASRTAIARGLVEWTENEELRKAYLSYDRSLVVSDPRRKEPKKFLRKAARARRQKSYR
ncbi:MAG: 30S ribosomal protein S9 [Canidatus Methanoxibalbensis ujae]|nr:30S ribosomal protein S9 [Candidatus Methanoxibalbensis ujae]MCW7079420.1 30S ribosomal protein S9 [Candidatus Methanoxibalbensis ujae]RLG38287.1 MAG: 30S ribosomal protein S9 [Methanosarcinales archaeon]